MFFLYFTGLTTSSQAPQIVQMTKDMKYSDKQKHQQPLSEKEAFQNFESKMKVPGTSTTQHQVSFIAFISSYLHFVMAILCRLRKLEINLVMKW